MNNQHSWAGAAAALLLAHGPAWAQGKVEVSGIVDAGLRWDSGASAGSIKSVGSGMRDANRLTFTGVEDLGSGLKAAFVLESGLALDTGAGANNPPGVAAGAMSFGRLAAVSVGSDATGYVSLGRQYVPMWAISAGPANDPFGAGWLGGITSLYSFSVRASNSVAYTYGYTAQATINPAPFKGLGVFLLYSAPETGGTDPKRAGEQMGGNVSWGDGPWWVGYGVHRIKGSNTAISATAPVTDAPTLKQQTLGLSYVTPLGRVHLGYNTGRNGLTGAGALDRSNWHVGANLLFAGQHNVRVLLGQSNDRTALNADRKTWQLGYGYNLSKRTNLYAAVGAVDNNATSNLTTAGALGTYALGATSRSAIVGVRHIF